MSDLVTILLYGLLAAVSPGALVATLAVLSTRRARANGSAFAIGFLLGQTFALVVPLAVGSIAVPGTSSTATAALELALGVLLLAAAARNRRQRKPSPAVGASPRTKALLARLDRVTPRTAFSVAFPFGIGVKRLVITIFAASTIAFADAGAIGEVGLGVVYVLVASVVVWSPVALYLVAGSSADELVSASKEWLAANQHKLTFLSSLLFGLFFTIGGLVQLA